MYTKELTQQIQKQTIALLKKEKDDAISLKDVADLRTVLKFHEYRYYILNDPLIADVEYDGLFKQLEKIEASNPRLVTADSPTQRVAKGLTKDFPTV